MNPLSKYTKIPSVYIKLCTNNLYDYKNTVVQDPYSEIGVCARSARDELMFNTPDALMNGEAVVEVIKNNAQKILDPNELYVQDVEQLLIAIKLATKEKTYSIETKCPECEKHGTFERDLQSLLDNAEYLKEIPTVILDELGLVIKVQPLKWKDRTKFNQDMFICHKRASILEKSEISDEDKMKEFSDIFDKMTEINFNMMVNNILSIEAPDAKVTEREYIREWLGEQPTFVLAKIKEGVSKFDSIGIEHTISAECSECQHVWEISGLYYDPSDFFVQSFSSQNQKK